MVPPCGEDVLVAARPRRSVALHQHGRRVGAPPTEGLRVGPEQCQHQGAEWSGMGSGVQCTLKEGQSRVRRKHSHQGDILPPLCFVVIRVFQRNQHLTFTEGMDGRLDEWKIGTAGIRYGTTAPARCATDARRYSQIQRQRCLKIQSERLGDLCKSALICGEISAVAEVSPRAPRGTRRARAARFGRDRCLM